jgi:hypothetical protein
MKPPIVPLSVSVCRSSDAACGVSDPFSAAAVYEGDEAD